MGDKSCGLIHGWPAGLSTMGDLEPPVSTMGDEHARDITQGKRKPRPPPRTGTNGATEGLAGSTPEHARLLGPGGALPDHPLIVPEAVGEREPVGGQVVDRVAEGIVQGPEGHGVEVV